jgi:hypothetical protein
MDAVSDQPPPDFQRAVGDLERRPSNPAQVHDEARELETEARQKDLLIHEPDNSATQKHSEQEDENPKSKHTDVAANNNNEKSSPGEEFSAGQKEQLMVKLKYKTKTTVTPPSDEQASANASSPRSSPVGTTGLVSNLSPRNVVIKQETEDHRVIPTQNSKTFDPQIKVEKNSDEEASAPKPLNEPEEELGLVKIAEDEYDHDMHQEGVPFSQQLVNDEMDVGAHQGEDAEHVSDSHDIPHQPSEAMAQDESRSDDIGGDFTQSEDVLPETARGDDTALDDDYTPEEMDPNELFSDILNQSEVDVGEASRHHQGQGHRAIDPQVASPDITYNGMNTQQQDQIEQLPQTCNTGQPDLSVQDESSSPQPDFSDPIHFTNESSSPHYQNSIVPAPVVTPEGFTQHPTPAPRHVLQQPCGPFSQPNFNPDIDHQQRLQAQVDEKKRQLENFKKLNEQRLRQMEQSPYAFGYSRAKSYAPSPVPMGPLTYQRAPQFGNSQPSNGLNMTGFQQPNLPTVPYNQISPNMSYSYNPVSMYQTMAKAPIPLSLKTGLPGFYVSQDLQKSRKQKSDEHGCGNEGDASDDDEPLRSRVKRHPSVTSSRHSVIGTPPPRTTSNRVARHTEQDDDSDVEFVTSKAKPNPTAPEAVQKQVGKSVSQPEPSSPTSPNNAASSPEIIGEIDWTLPQYEIQRQPLAKGEEIPSAKVSLPGLVREELLLSPDHADEEVHLLMNIFIPNQQTLPTPDPEPAIAVLNFHTIAVMVIEAYVQYEIGDEFGTGRGHFHTEHDQGDTDYERMRDAVDADPNEIFFAVVDRYRAGLESKKKPLQLIRGTQEFCDVALDVIYYIKDHGLLKPEPEPKAKAVKADKVVNKGKAKAGTKRGTTAKPNEVQPRKKAKTTTAATAGVKKKRAKPKTLGVTVVRK